MELRQYLEVEQGWINSLEEKIHTTENLPESPEAVNQALEVHTHTHARMHAVSPRDPLCLCNYQQYRCIAVNESWSYDLYVSLAHALYTSLALTPVPSLFSCFSLFELL